MAENKMQNIYDQVPYPSLPFPQTHPDRLATIATLLGMHPTPPEHSRVLELGCASGGNLIPMALGLPDSTFMGIDLSGQQIAEGQTTVDTLRLKNITLEHMDILDVDANFGQYDYIIAHGVYSWVPPLVRDKILEICRQNLAPNGVAYVSYNTYPGWHMHKIVRDMMLYHIQQVSEPEEQVVQARHFLDFLASLKPAKGNAHANFLNAYINFAKERFWSRGNDIFLLHDDLAEVNEPVYFYQFADHAAQHGLQYLAEAQFQTMLASNLPTEVSTELRRWAKDTIAIEQYMDFFRNRLFRQTLLCHHELQLKSKLTLDRLAEFYVASPTVPENGKLDIQSASVEKFYAPRESVLSTDHPVTKAAMLHLSEVWPQRVSFNTLLAEARRRLNGGVKHDSAWLNHTIDAEMLGANLLKAYGYSENLVELHICTPQFVVEISDCPEASSLARFQVQNGPLVTNLRHELLKLEGINCRLLPLLDGSRNRAALVQVLKELPTESIIELEEDGQGNRDTPPQKDDLTTVLDSVLRALANAALLVG